MKNLGLLSFIAVLVTGALLSGCGKSYSVGYSSTKFMKCDLKGTLEKKGDTFYFLPSNPNTFGADLGENVPEETKDELERIRKRYVAEGVTPKMEYLSGKTVEIKGIVTHFDNSEKTPNVEIYGIGLADEQPEKGE